MSATTAPTSFVQDLLGAPDIPMSEEEKGILEEKKKALDAVFDSGELARFKLEVMFSHRHSGRTPTPGTVTFWESGNKLHGGGDSKLYVCDSADAELAKQGCKGFLPDSANGLRFIVCPHCQKLWNAQDVVGEVFYRLPLERWADVLLSWFRRLEMRADIRIKYAKDDIRVVSANEQEKQRMGDLLQKARSFDRRPVYIYPLKNIIKDTSSGADLRGRILAFLKA
jgi:hypothetical protein